MTERNLPSRTANTPAVSLRERSTEALTQATRLPGDEAYVLERTRVCLSCFYEPDMLPEDRAAMMDEFGRALRTFPRWSVSKAFDAWMRTAQRRPSPGEIAILAGRELKAVTDEIALRRKLEVKPEPPRAKPDAAAAAEILNRAGWTPNRMAAIRNAHPLVGSMNEAETARATARVPHWSETAAPDDPRFTALRKAREGVTQ